MVNPFNYDKGLFLIVGFPDGWEVEAEAYFSYDKQGVAHLWGDVQRGNGPFDRMELTERLHRTTALTRKLRNAIRWYEDRVARR